MRMRIAQIAARIMAEDGIDDFGLAKRKAARQIGAPDTWPPSPRRGLPPCGTPRWASCGCLRHMILIWWDRC